MATRSTTDNRREGLKAALRGQCQTGEWKVGRAVPSVRELVLQHKTSKEVVLSALRDLVAEGVLYTVPRVGTFVGRAPSSRLDQLFVIVGGTEALPDRDITARQMQSSFEEFVAQRGGSAIWLSFNDFQELYRHGMPNLAGIYDLSWRLTEEWMRSSGSLVPVVRISGPALAHSWFDIVSFDDRRGGRDAALHLLERGHKKIGFLGVHLSSSPDLYWSEERAIGWQEILCDAGISPELLLFVPQGIFPARTHTTTDQYELAVHVAKRLIPKIDSEEITGIVAANDAAAAALIQVLRQSSTRLERWPAIVSFDDELPKRLHGEAERSHLLTSLRLPWDELGRTAAQLLWERSQGRVQIEPMHRVVPMQLIPRLSCRADWPLQIERLAQTSPKPLTHSPVGLSQNAL